MRYLIARPNDMVPRSTSTLGLRTIARSLGDATMHGMITSIRALDLRRVACLWACDRAIR